MSLYNFPSLKRFFGQSSFILFTASFCFFYIDFFWDIGNHKTLLYFGTLFWIFFLAFRSKGDASFDLDKSLSWALLGVSFVLLLSLSFSYSPYLKKNYAQNILFFALVVFFFYYWLSVSSQRLKYIVFIACVALFVSSVVVELYGVLIVHPRSSYFWNPHYLANYCLISIIFFSCCFVRWNNYVARFAFLALIILTCYLLLKSQSRPAWISIFFVAVAMTCIYLRGRRLLVALLCMFSCIAFLYLVFPSAFGDRINQLLYNIYDEERVRIWADSLVMLSDMPVGGWFFGYGPGSSQSFMPSYMADQYSNIEFPHNFIIELIFESGLVGLCLWSFIFYFFFRVGVRGAAIDGCYRPYILIMLWGMAAHLGFVSVIIPFYSKHVLLSQAPFWGLIFWLSQKNRHLSLQGLSG
ncbi:MAG: hypothetical protein AWU57_646 [Marinobacter sp. T13-3]|nr:MAG: hypothetical protein AWU57_646 [Marinobacter sp. T13-3]